MSPLILIVTSYIVGIILGKLMSLPPRLSFFAIIFLLLGSFYLAISKKQSILILLLLLIFILGFTHVQLKNQDRPLVPMGETELVGSIIDEPRIFDDKVSFVLKTNKTSYQVMAPSIPFVYYGDKVWVNGLVAELESLDNPGIFGFKDYLEKQGVSARLVAKQIRILGKGGNWFKKKSILIRRDLVKIPSQILPEPYATLLSSIVFGSKAVKLPPDLKESYRRAGVAHLLVASGMHLGILIGVILAIGRFLKFPIWLNVAIATNISWFYTIMVGAGPSILRAAVMVQIAMLSLLFDKQKDFVSAFSLAALVILIINPLTLFEVGFQLSFAATWGLVYIAPAIADKTKAVIPNKFLNNLFSVALAPVLATAPICAFHFNELSLIGILTNMLILPWVAAVLILGFASILFGIIFMPLSYILGGANLVLLAILNQIILILASFPFATRVFSTPPWILIIIYYLGLIFWVEHSKRKIKFKLPRRQILILVLALFALMIWNNALAGVSNNLKITVLDVGQGDSILIEAPTGEKILVDGGDQGMGDKIILLILKKKGITSLDKVFLTHPHADHIAGLLEVVKKMSIKEVFDPGQEYDSFYYRNFLNLVNKNKIKYRKARAGQYLSLSKNVTAQVLHPTDSFFKSNDPNINNYSIAFRLMYKDFSMLFTGDLEYEGEESVLSSFPPESLKSHILKVGHHGSRTATSLALLSKVQPQVAVISCGRRNKFRHPHRAALERLQKQGGTIYRTDQDGAVVIKTDGKMMQITTSK